jgi:O-antigen/teichoic acid export membrane protein
VRSGRKYDLAIALALLVLPLLWFWPQTFGGRTLLPVDNLYQYQPWQTYAAQMGAAVPYNPLISDLVLENLPWKTFIIEQLRAGRPADLLWNPLTFAGVPFLAAGQHSALYPLSILFYILPLWQAYGIFSALQLGIAALAMFVFARVLGQRRPGAVVAAVAYAFSGFYIVSVNFTMMIAAAAWLPLILAMIEIMIRKQEQKGPTAYSPVPYVLAGALLVGVQMLAGHIEITYYVLLVSALYAGWRLLGAWRRLGTWRPLPRLAAWLIVMVGLGLALSAVQLLPLYELVSQSFRQGSASLAQVRDWAWPSRQIVTFLLPDFFGNPTHHSFFDIWRGAWTPVTQNAPGKPLTAIDWGVKNYVEGANYLGVMTLALAAIGAIAAGSQVIGSKLKVAGSGLKVADAAKGADTFNLQASTFTIAGFALLAVLSLLFAFGTPLYAIPFYLLPGYNQLHSAFRWVYPYTLSMALLAGFGMSALLERSNVTTLQRSTFNLQSAVRWLGIALALGGAGVLAIVGISIVAPAPFVGLGDRILAASDLARERGFADGAMAWSYTAFNLARFGLLAGLTGLVLTWAGRAEKQQEHKDGRRTTWPFAASRQNAPVAPSTFPVHPVTLSPGHPVTRSLWPLAAIAVLILDLWLFGHGFNPAVDPALLAFKPPVIGWLQAQREPTQPWRLTSFDGPDEKTLNANSAMTYGLEDVRGYDSIIPKQYVEYMKRIHPQGELLYNRIAAIYTQLGERANYEALDHPLLRLLGVRYVVTTSAIPNADYRLAYNGEVKVYENSRALPRAFIVPQAVAAADQTAALDALAGLDPAQIVVVEGLPTDAVPAPASPAVREARISKYTPREIFIDVNLSDRGWLVLTDNFADGWKAYVRTFGVTGEGITASGEAIEQQLPLYRADGAFRTVYLPQAGQWTVRFVYSPRSFILGLYASFLAAITLVLLGGWWTWGRLYRGDRSEVGRVAKNSAVQMATALMTRGIDFAFAMLRLRILSPAGEGAYAFAITFYATFEIVTRFGLGTLLTRDIAKDKDQARRYLVNVISLRTLLWLASLPIMAIVLLAYRSRGQLAPGTEQAIALFVAALLFANIADALSAVFFAFEQMEHPAGIATATAVAKVALSALVLMPPFELGFVGLAGVSLVMNVVQVVWLYSIMRRTVLPVENRSGRVGEWESSPTPPFSHSLRRLDWALQRYMLGASGPLMINHLLASVFWRINLYILQWFAGASAVGIFSAATKYIDGLNVIPSYFTLAIFPMMSRYAQGQTDALARAYRLAVQLLLILALPISVAFTFLATPLIRILGGAAYLPDSAIALQIMIWSIPIGWVNSVTQYVLISVNQQRFLTRAFIIGVVFTGIANLVLVPRFGYVASAALLTPAELALFIPFYLAVRRHVTRMPWLRLCGGPLLAAGINVAAVWGLERAGIPTLVAIVAGFLVYLAVLTVLGTFRSEDFGMLMARLPKVKLPGQR